MLRVSRLSLFLLPNSRSPELPNFLAGGSAAQAPHNTVDDLIYKTVMEYDHGAAMPDVFDQSYRSFFFATQPFSASKSGAFLTVVGIMLFSYTFGYNIGKPVVDAHRELLFALPEPEDDAEEDEMLKNIIEDDEFD